MYESWLADLLGIRKLTVNGGAALPQSAWVDFVGSGITGTYDAARQCVVLTFATTGGTNTFGLKEVCKAATTANITLSGLQTIDGVPLGVDDRALVCKQAVQADNGIYLVKETAWVRAPDADTNTELPSATIVPVDQGTQNADSLWRLTTNAPIVVGVSALVFERFDGADARALQGFPISETDPTTSQALVFDGAEWVGALLTNDSIDPAAEIEVSKLEAGAENQVVTTVGGVPQWGALSPQSVGENVITTPSIASTQNNYSPAGWDTATVVRLESSEDAAGRYINGFGPATVKRKLLINPKTTRPFVFPHMAGGQAAGNQIATPSHEEFRLEPGCSCWVFQDAVSGVWWVVGQDPLSYVVNQAHDIPIGSFMHHVNAGGFADQFMTANSSSSGLGIQLYSARGTGNARACWHLGRWQGTITDVYVEYGVGDFAGGDAPGSTGAIQLMYIEPNVADADFTGAKKIYQVDTVRTVSVTVGQYAQAFNALSLDVDPVLGTDLLLLARAGAGPGYLNIHTITAYVNHLKLRPLP